MKKIIKTFLSIILFGFIFISASFATFDNNSVNIINENNINEINNENIIVQEENDISNDIENVTSETKIVESDTRIVEKIDGIWRMVINGVVDYNYTGIGTNENGTWYLENGKVTFNYKGTYTEGTKAYIIEESKVVTTVTTTTTEVIKINGIWRMVKNGVVDYNYTGIGTNDKGTWLVEKGTVTFKYTGNYTDTAGKTYIIEKSEVKTNLTTVMKINNIWRMVKNGVVDYNYTGIGTNDKGIWYLENGKVTFNYKGTYTEGTKAYIIEGSQVYATVTISTTEVIKINNIWRMVINGVVDYNYTGIGTNDKGTWLVEKGTVTFKYTGNYTDTAGKTYIIENSQVRTNLTTVMKINNIWRMVINGVVDYNYTGIGKNENGTWYLEKGTVNFGYTGTYFEGDKAYIVEAGEVKAQAVKEGISLVKIDTTWRVVVNGYVDYKYEGIVTNEKGTWLVENGTVTFKYTGDYTDTAGKTYIIEKSEVRTNLTTVMKINNIWRMVINGVVDYNYTGIGKNENGTWYLEKGTVNFGYTGTYFEGDKAYIVEAGKVKAQAVKEGISLVKIDTTWRVVVNGYVDYKYEGIVTNEKGTWLVENGTVTFRYIGSYTDAEGTTYIIQNSEVMTKWTKVIKINNVWRMVVKGIVDYDYTGIGSNENGTWIVENGKVTFNYKGTYTEGTTAYIIEGSKVYATVTTSTTDVIKINGTWRMVKNGVVDYNFTGIGTNSLGMWILQKGAVNFNYTGKYTDTDGSIYNIKNGEVREVISRAGHPGTMCIDEPANGVKRTTGVLNIVGWVLTQETGDTVQIYLDGKYVGVASRKNRQDVLDVFKNQYGGSASNPQPGFSYSLNISGLSRGTHTIRVVNLASDKKTIIQSREVQFSITKLTETKGIDVSHHNGAIDWRAVKNSGVDFAIIKIGEYHESSGTIVKDSYFDANYTACKSLGIAVGGYFYSYAFNSAEASREASACLQIINGKSFEMPIFLDVEDNILKNAVSQGKTNKNELTNASITFCDIMNSAGYKAGVYASRNFFYEYLNVSALERYNIWLAHYATQTDYTGKFDVWQYTSSGSIPGINGFVDLDWCFTRYY